MADPSPLLARLEAQRAQRGSKIQDYIRAAAARKAAPGINSEAPRPHGRAERDGGAAAAAARRQGGSSGAAAPLTASGQRHPAVLPSAAQKAAGPSVRPASQPPSPRLQTQSPRVPSISRATQENSTLAVPAARCSSGRAPGGEQPTNAAAASPGPPDEQAMQLRQQAIERLAQQLHCKELAALQKLEEALALEQVSSASCAGGGPRSWVASTMPPECPLVLAAELVAVERPFTATCERYPGLRGS